MSWNAEEGRRRGVYVYSFGKNIRKLEEMETIERTGKGEKRKEYKNV